MTIGVETNPANPEKVTFYEEGYLLMEQELALVSQYYQNNPAWAGLAIHDYEGYYELTTRINYFPALTYR